MNTFFIVVPGHSSSMNSVIYQLQEFRNKKRYWEIVEAIAAVTSFDIERALDECSKNNIPPNRYSQPLQYLLGYVSYKEKFSHNPKPQAVTGHSLGEILAMAIAGSISWIDGFQLVIACGSAMDSMHIARPGAMTALLGISTNEVSEICTDISQTTGKLLEISNINSTNQIVVSGDIECIEEIEKLLSNNSLRYVRLGIAGAAHSSMYGGSNSMQRVIDSIEIRDPLIPIYLSTIAKPINESLEVKGALEGLLINQVNWVRNIRNIYHDFPGIQLITLFSDKGMNSIIKNSPSHSK